MINIYLCDDDTQQLNTWRKIIEDYLVIKKLNQQLICASETPSALLETLDSYPKTMGLYFLDICLQADMNGLQLAAKIRKLDPLGEIVFITSKSEVCFLTFEYHVGALDFIVKDMVSDLPAKIHRCMDLASLKEMQLVSLAVEPLNLKINRERVCLNPDDIIYIETTRDTIHKITIYTRTGLETIYSTLKEMETVLQKYDCFFRCNKSVIVNRKHIKKSDTKKKELHLSNGTTISVSSRQLKSLQ